MSSQDYRAMSSQDYQDYHRYVSERNWAEPDLSIVDDRRGPVPAVPLALLPPPWRDWIAETETVTGAPADYVLQSVLAGVAAVCGAAVRVRVTPAWDEPLVLWLAAVGEASSGKSAALAPMRRLLETVEQEWRLGDAERRSAHAERCKQSGEDTPFVPAQIVASGSDRPGALADIVAGNPRGVLLWREGAPAWIDEADEEGADRASWLAAWSAGAITLAAPRQSARILARAPARTAGLTVPHFAVSLLEAVRPDRLKASLEAGDGDGFAARFLFAWPGPQPYRGLAVLDAPRDEEILRRLRALARLGNGADDPHFIEVDARGRAALDAVLAGLHEERRLAEGLEAAWLGRSRSLIVRLAGVLELMASVDGIAVRRPGAIGAEQVEAAAALWRDYFRPHARAVFDSAALSDAERRARRVARWLLATRPQQVSREEVRRQALCQAATADETQSALQRLAYLGFVKAVTLSRDGAGRPPNLWRLNPVLATPENG
jgi:hypothetical protein